MRQAVIQVTCDLCKEKFNEDAYVSNVVLQVGNDPQVEFDICDECASKRPFEDVFVVSRVVPKPKKPGRKPKAATTADAEAPPQRNVPCDVKGCTFMGVSLQSVGTHKARAHKAKPVKSVVVKATKP